MRKQHVRSVRVLLLTAAAVVACGWQSVFAQSCSSDISRRKEHAYDVLLELSSREQSYVERVHFLYGQPGPSANATNESLLHQDEYIINYDADLRSPIWAAYRLSAEHLAHSRERTECFRRDIRLDDGAVCEDFAEPVFDRGHMVPNADMVRSEPAMINTYILSNMAPQHDRFNRGIWSRLESRVRDWVRVRGHCHIITGAVYDKNDDGQRDADGDADLMGGTAPGREKRIGVPTHFYKIVLHERASGFIDTITILLPHVDVSPTGQEVDPYLTEHIVSIATIQTLTGCDFLPDLEDRKEFAVEHFEAAVLWPTD